MNGRASYGELMRKATRRIAVASGLLAEQPLPDRAQALCVLAALSPRLRTGSSRPASGPSCCATR